MQLGMPASHVWLKAASSTLTGVTMLYRFTWLLLTTVSNVFTGFDAHPSNQFKA
jgi:hypothetical protein